MRVRFPAPHGPILCRDFDPERALRQYRAKQAPGTNDIATPALPAGAYDYNALLE